MRIEQVADTVHLVEAEAVNWTIVSGPDGVTLIDAGYPGDHDDVLASLTRTGHTLDDLRAILVTHAHVDHIGAIPQLLERVDVPVWTSVAEARHARREYLEQATPMDVARNAWRPGALAWTRHILAKGATRPVAVPTAAGVPEGAPLDVPGAPVPLVVPGHTSGHTCYLLEGGSVVVTGDALCTGHMLSRRKGPQLLPGFFDHDRAQHVAELPRLADLAATTMLPGHGPVYRGSMAEAVAEALR